MQKNLGSRLKPTLLGFGAIQIFIFILMSLVGVQTLEATRILVVLLAQTSPGLIIWIALDSKNLSSPALAIGAGTTIGLCFSTLAQILIGSDRIWGLGWLVPLLLAIPLLLVINKRFTGELVPSTNTVMERVINWLPVIVLASLIGLQEQWWWTLPILIVIAIYVVIQLRSKITRNWNCVFLLALPVTWLLSVHLRKWNLKWWVYSNDISWLTSKSFSINQWGRNENVGAVGQVFRYHWFALKWSGMTTELADAGTWTLITFVLPIVACITIALLVWGITYEQTGSKVASAFAAFMVLLIRDVVSGSSPTHLFAFMPMLTIVALTLRSTKNCSVLYPKFALIGLLIFALLGSKISTGLVLVGGLLIFSLIDNGPKIKDRVLLVFVSLIAIVCGYLFFFKGSTKIHSLNFGFSNAGGNLIFSRAAGGGRAHFFLENFLLVLYVAPYLGGLIMFWATSKSMKIGTPTKLLISISFAGILLARFLDGEGTESYFVHATFPILALLFVFGMNSSIYTIKSVIGVRLVVVITAIGVIAGFLNHMLSRTNYFQEIFFVPKVLVPYFLMYAILSAVLVAVYLYFRRAHGRLPILIFAIAILLTSTMIGEQLDRRYSFTKYAATGKPDPLMTKTNYITGSADQIAALNWLREETPSDDIVATNRFCLSLTSCATPKWSLVSAMGHRRMLIEAPMHFSTSGPWVGERLDYSQQFVVTPSVEHAATLWNLGVRWQYIDLDFIGLPSGWEPLEVAQKRSWEPWAETVFKNDTVAILRIKDPAGN